MVDHFISIIIPTLNEEKNIDRIIKNINSINEKNIEIIICDGGSSDNTQKKILDNNSKMIVSKKGRGIQMNSGADIAKGDIFLFLHSDSLLSKKFYSEIIKILSKKNVVAGAFKFKLSRKSYLNRIIEFFVNLRSIFLQLPYGDQGIFLNRENFYKVCKFPETPIMEDYILINKLKKLGKIKISKEYIITSERRWNKLGFLKTFIINQLIILGYYLNIKLEKLDRLYRK